MARKFSKAYPVVLLARNPSHYEPVAHDIRAAGGQAIGIKTDLTDPKSVKSAFSQISESHANAKLAAAIFNAGAPFVRKPFLEITEEEFTAGYESQGYVFCMCWIFNSNINCSCILNCSGPNLDKCNTGKPDFSFPRAFCHTSLRQRSCLTRQR